MTERVVAVVVTYHPDLPALDALLDALSRQVAAVLVVDNGSGAVGLAPLCERLDADLIALGTNEGIAAAQNRGIERALAAGASHVLLSDQDSLPAPDMVDRLLAATRAATDRGERVGAVGPVSVDARSNDEVMVYRAARWGPRRSSCISDQDGLIPAAFLLASGCLVSRAVLEEVGPMRAEWFIDHVDLEWGLRARRAGYDLYAVESARLEHHLGDRLVRLPGRRQEVHVHGPIRVYYLTRNTLLLVRSGLLPHAWRLGYLVWVTKFAGFNVLLVRPRGERLRMVARGLRDGVLGRTGPYG